MYKTKKIVLSFCLISVSLAVSAQNKKLHNGIVYPEQWPPRYEEPAVAQDMPVPYLKEKPAVIPVNLGRQLFVDDFLIAETDLQPTSNPQLSSSASFLRLNVLSSLN